ncbi:DUF58 domain-containing protein [Demequina mangrovi]|uniref:Uncharacterized conserved protein, DUF58 family, contains vWF domain n=1 Tax=Demequina mangrovi TaxID=1043493 RepID=A0A1H7AKM0_9MICO|nr:DUF58 domain-containing protein [Demequina mangrovi]SEJ65898.1 Uncharacterized conserved protein, DUF58 family, contains vWF domain [Demequina mangrovi]
MSERPDLTATRTRTAATGTYSTRTEVADVPRGRVVGARLRFDRAARTVGDVGSSAWRSVRGVVTPAGWAVAGWTVLGLAAGLGWGWEEALVAGVAGLLLLAAAVPFLLGDVSYRVTFELDRDAVVAGEPTAGSVVVVNEGRRAALPGTVELPVGEALVELHVPLLRGGATWADRVVIPARRRGIVDVGPAASTRTDPLHLLRRHRAWDEVQTLYVHPRTVEVPSTSLGWVRDLEGQAVRILTSEDISFHAVREYQRGDAQRHIHWKSTAKTGTLMVRQFEETRRSLLTLVLDADAASYRDEEEFEMAVSALASLGTRAIRDGREVRVVASGEVPEFARASVRALRALRVGAPRALLDDLSGIEASEDAMALATVTRMVAENDQGTSLAVLITGSALGHDRLRTAALRLPADVSVGAVVCAPAQEPRMHALGGIQLVSLGVLDDLRHLLARGAARA